MKSALTTLTSIKIAAFAYHTFKNEADPNIVQPVSDINIVAKALDDIVISFTMSDINVRLNWFVADKFMTITNWYFERNGNVFEIARETFGSELLIIGIMTSVNQNPMST